jgi:hypothetical protein
MMEAIEIVLRGQLTSDQLIALIERVVVDAGLVVAVRTTLRTYPGSTHWHTQQPGTKGVLEITYWPNQQRLWFAVQANRRADWIRAAIQTLKQRILEEAFCM